jgi:hypothetical protein
MSSGLAASNATRSAISATGMTQCGPIDSRRGTARRNTRVINVNATMASATGHLGSILVAPASSPAPESLPSTARR